MAYEPEYFAGDPYGPLETRKKQLEAQKLYLMAQASDAARVQNPGKGQMVGGWYVPPSPLESLQKPLAQAIAGHRLRKQAQDEAAYDAEEKGAAAAVMNSVPQAKTTTSRMANPPGEEPGYLESTKTTQPTREDKLKWAQQGMAVPSLRKQLEKFYDDQLINEPIREEGRAEKRADREDRQADMALRQRLEIEYKKADLAQRAEVARQRSEDMRLSIRERADAAKRHDDLMAELGRGRLAQGQQKIDAAKGKMTDKARADLDAYNASATGLDNAIAALGGATEKGTGYLAGLVQDKVPGGQSLVAGRRDKATNDAIQQLTYWTDAIRHDRFGSALTATEKSSASQYLPSEYDDLDAIKRKAVGLKGLMGLNHRRLRSQYGDEATGGQSGNASGNWGTPPPARRSAPPPSAGASAPRKRVTFDSLQ